MYFVFLNTRYNTINYHIVLGKIGIGTHDSPTGHWPLNINISIYIIINNSQ